MDPISFENNAIFIHQGGVQGGVGDQYLHPLTATAAAAPPLSSTGVSGGGSTGVGPSVASNNSHFNIYGDMNTAVTGSYRVKSKNPTPDKPTNLMR